MYLCPSFEFTLMSRNTQDLWDHFIVDLMVGCCIVWGTITMGPFAKADWSSHVSLCQMMSLLATCSEIFLLALFMKLWHELIIGSFVCPQPSHECKVVVLRICRNGCIWSSIGNSKAVLSSLAWLYVSQCLHFLYQKNRGIHTISSHPEIRWDGGQRHIHVDVDVDCTTNTEPSKHEWGARLRKPGSIGGHLPSWLNYM